MEGMKDGNRSVKANEWRSKECMDVREGSKGTMGRGSGRSPRAGNPGPRLVGEIGQTPDAPEGKEGHG